MQCANATNLHGKSGGAKPRDLRFHFPTRDPRGNNSKGAPGLTFETWDPRNRSRLETLPSPLSSRPGFPATQLWTTPRMRLSRKERRMQCANATNLHRKSGGAKPRDLRFHFPTRDPRGNKSKGAPGLAFETWDPRNRSRLETLPSPLSSRPGSPATQLWTTPRMRLSRKERRMQCANATNLHRKSGGAKPRDLRFHFPTRNLRGNNSKGAPGLAFENCDRLQQQAEARAGYRLCRELNRQTSAYTHPPRPGCRTLRPRRPAPNDGGAESA